MSNTILSPIERVPHDICGLIFSQLESATDLRSFTLASPNAAAAFIDNTKPVLVDLLCRIIDWPSFGTATLIHRHDIHPNLTEAQMMETIPGAEGPGPTHAQSLRDLLKLADLEVLRTTYWLCLRHEPFVEDALKQSWVVDWIGTPFGRWCSHNTERGALPRITRDTGMKFLGGFFLLELILRSEGTQFGPDTWMSNHGKRLGSDTLFVKFGRELTGHHGAWCNNRHQLKESKGYAWLLRSVLEHYASLMETNLGRIQKSAALTQAVVANGEGILLPEQTPILERYKHLILTCLLDTRGKTLEIQESYLKGKARHYAEGEDVAVDMFLNLTHRYAGIMDSVWSPGHFDTPRDDFFLTPPIGMPAWDLYTWYDHENDGRNLYEQAMEKAQSVALEESRKGNQAAVKFIERGYRTQRRLQERRRKPRRMPPKRTGPWGWGEPTASDLIWS